MADLAGAWGKVLPEVRNGVTGVGVWTALNSCRPIALENGVLVLGLPHESSALSGHLRQPASRMLIEKLMAQELGQAVELRVIEGISEADWETIKRRDTEQRRLQEQALNRAKAEVQARTSWDGVYEQLTRKYATIQNKSLPQNRARFYLEAIELVVESMKDAPVQDDLSERNFARCLERIAQYSEVPSVIVAVAVLERSAKP